MLNFTVKFPASRPSPVGKELLKFAVTGSTVLFAGSRHIELNRQLCAGLLSAFSSRGASFLTGCCFKGVDKSFRGALSEGGYHDKSFIACAFNQAADKMDLPAKKVVSDGLPAKVSLARRTVWMCGEASLLILFPSDPIGRGSSLAFKTMTQANKPVFMVSEIEPEPSSDYEVYPSVLFNLVRGWWVLPHRHPSRDSEKIKNVKQPADKPKRVTGPVLSAGPDPVGVL